MTEVNICADEGEKTPLALKAGLGVSAVLFMAAWFEHLYTATIEMRGFFGDGSLAFLIYLSDSYVFNKAGNLVHLFPVGFPRDFQMLLNAIGLQAALWLRVENPSALKLAFGFWQFFLPGFLYLSLFAILWRKRLSVWIVFPLVSWAVLSIPVEWSAPNSTRWAMPLFWMHFMLVILSGSKIKFWPLAGALLAGTAMLGGLYESVVLHCALCLFLGALFWFKRKTPAPFVYALAAIPGSLRAALTYVESGHLAPNGFTGLTLPYALDQPTFLFIACVLAVVAALGSGKIALRHAWMPLALLLWPAANALTFDPPDVWQQINMRFDYVIISLLLMLWAGLVRLFGNPKHNFVVTASLIACLTGTILWTSQTFETVGWWKSCRSAHAEDLKGQTINISPTYRALFADDSRVTSLPYRKCMWDWAQPWTDMLDATEGKVSSWSILTFWQDFSFVQKDEQIYMRTNNWTLNSPSMQPDGAELPLKTMLYDMTPLYEKVGLGSFAKREHCLPVEYSGKYWQNHLTKIGQAKRRLMFVCPQNQN